jgi:hypothetical protein
MQVCGCGVKRQGSEALALIRISIHALVRTLVRIGTLSVAHPRSLSHVRGRRSIMRRNMRTVNSPMLGRLGLVLMLMLLRRRMLRMNMTTRVTIQVLIMLMVWLIMRMGMNMRRKRMMSMMRLVPRPAMVRDHTHTETQPNRSTHTHTHATAPAMSLRPEPVQIREHIHLVQPVQVGIHERFVLWAGKAPALSAVWPRAG